MRIIPFLSALAAFSTVSSTLHDRQAWPTSSPLKPKVFIVSTFSTEAEAWRGAQFAHGLDVFGQKIVVPGLSPLFPVIHCTENGDVCLVTTGEGGKFRQTLYKPLFNSFLTTRSGLEINAALSTSALLQSKLFDLKQTYFLIAGIASINPKLGTLGSITFARFTVQFGLQYEIDGRDTPNNFSSGYVPQGAKKPGDYRTEVFELNDALRKTAARFAQRATLNDSDAAVVYRSHYQSRTRVFKAGASPPGIEQCDAITSDTWYSGSKIGEAIEQYVKLVTNGTGKYCTAAQEDNAILAALFRAAVAKAVDFSRIILMRTGSDFDREYPGQQATENLLWVDQGGKAPALRNINLAGSRIVNGILADWNKTFENGVQTKNYVGDMFGTLGGTPDFGPGKVPGASMGEDTL